MKAFSKKENACPDSGDVALERMRFAAFCLTLVGTAFSISVTSIGSVTYVIFLILSAVKRPSVMSRPIFLPLLACFAASLLISMALNGFPAESPQGLLKYFWGFLMLYAGMDVMRTRRRWLAAATVMLACTGLAALSGIGQDFIGRDFINGRLPVPYTETIHRITGPFKHCNDFGTFLIPGWLFGCSLVVDRLRRKKTAAAAVGVFLLILIAWAFWRTMARGAMIGAGAGMIVLALTLPYRGWVLSTMASCGALAWLIPSTLSARLHELVVFGGVMQERIYLLKGALKMVAASPWFGLGPNTYSKWYPIFNPSDPKHPILMYAHNSYLQQATETGWIGLALFLAFLCACVTTAARWLGTKAAGEDGVEIRWIRAAALASAVGLLVNALFDSLLQSTQLRTLFWCLLGLALAYPAVRESDPSARFRQPGKAAGTVRR